MRHDAQKAREQAKSQSIRISLGIKTPEELKREAEAGERRRLQEAKEAARGVSLFDEEG